MAATYPGSVRSFTTKVDNIDVNFALHINDLQDEVVAIQSVLGISPQGAATGPATVGKRITDVESGKAASVHAHTFDTTNHDVTARHTFGAALGTPGTPATIIFGGAGTAGTGTVPARSDHNHPAPPPGDLANAVFPPGCIIAFGGSSAPGGWVLCDGASYLRGTSSADTYYNLYQTIGTAYGSADGTHFNVPDFRRAFPMGKAASGTGSTLGANGGTKDAVIVTHAHTGSSVTDGAANHSHYVEHQHTTGDAGAHSHSVNGDFGDRIVITYAGSTLRLVTTAGQEVTWSRLDGAPNHNHGNTGNMTARATSDGASGFATHGHGLTIASQGVSGTDQNLPPYMTVNWIIKL